MFILGCYGATNTMSWPCFDTAMQLNSLMMPHGGVTAPCNLDFSDSPIVQVAVTAGSPMPLGSSKTVGERGAPAVIPLNPNSRRGRKTSPLRQGRVAMESIFVGIDVSKDRLDVAMRPAGESFVVERNAKGLDFLCTKLKELSPQLIALEATGGFETVVTAALASAKLPVVIVNPAQVRSFAKALGQRAKTDAIDAEVIARFAEATKPELRALPDEQTQLLADLVGRRRQIIEMIGAERQREKRATKRLKKSIARLLKALEKELSASIPTSMMPCAAHLPGGKKRIC